MAIDRAPNEITWTIGAASGASGSTVVVVAGIQVTVGSVVLLVLLVVDDVEASRFGSSRNSLESGTTTAVSTGSSTHRQPRVGSAGRSSSNRPLRFTDTGWVGSVNRLGASGSTVVTSAAVLSVFSVLDGLEPEPEPPQEPSERAMAMNTAMPAATESLSLRSREIAGTSAHYAVGPPPLRAGFRHHLTHPGTISGPFPDLAVSAATAGCGTSSGGI